MGQYKKAESVLVVIYCQTTSRCLMLQRKDDPFFWQSVTGSLEENETPTDTAIREILEEIGIDVKKEPLELINADYAIEFDIFPQFRHKYAPNVTRNKEHWFYLPLMKEITPVLTEHLDYKWLSVEDSANLTLSPNNSDAIKQISSLNCI